jgi:hypothetical protein
MGTVCYKRALSKLGVEPVIDGFWGACMQRLKAGIKLETPDGVRTFRGGTVLLAADTPAAAQLTGTKEAVGPSTFSICRNCHCEQTRMRTPNSFVAELPGWRARCDHRKAEFRQRSTADLKEYLAKVQQMLDGKLKKADLDLWMKSMGVNSFCTALTCVPYYSPVNGSPHDPMHIVFEGIARQLLGALSFYLKKWGVDSLEIPARLSAWARGTGRCRAHYPYMNTGRCVFTDANARAHTRKHYKHHSRTMTRQTGANNLERGCWGDPSIGLRFPRYRNANCAYYAGCGGDIWTVGSGEQQKVFGLASSVTNGTHQSLCLETELHDVRLGPARQNYMAA